MRKRKPNSRLPSNVHPVILQLASTRIDRGITQLALSDALGYHNKTISYCERQERNLSFQFLVDYADYLGYDIVLAPKGPSQ